MGFLSRLSMTAAFNTIAKQIDPILLNNEMHDLRRISDLKLFKDIGDIYKSKGLSKWGAIFVFCNHMMIKHIDAIEKDKNFDDLDLYVSDIVTIASSITKANDIAFTKADLGTLELMGENLGRWLEITETDSKRELYNFLGI